MARDKGQVTAMQVQFNLRFDVTLTQDTREAAGEMGKGLSLSLWELIGAGEVGFQQSGLQ